MEQLIFLCIKIFFCRIIDVSLSTVRMVVIVKGKTVLASLIAFIEGLIWFLVVREALLFNATSSIDNLIIAIVYSAGFAVGTFCGTKISNLYVQTMVLIQVITSKKDDSIIEELRSAGYAISAININASNFGPEKYMLLSEISSTHLNDFKSLVNKLDPKAFIVVNETKYVFNGFFRGKSK